MENESGGEQIIDAERSGLYDQALLACMPGTQVPSTPEAVDDLLGLYERLRDAGDCARYLQGGVLAALLENDRWRQKRPDLTFAEFCEQEVGLSYRTAKYLIDLYTKGIRLGLTPDRIQRIGWTKAREILTVATPDNVQTWIDEAQTSTRVELRERVQIEKAKRTAARADLTPPEPLVSLTVRVTLELRDFINMALEAAAVEAADDPSRPIGKGAALGLICMQYMANRLPLEKGVAWAIGQMARVYGVKLQVVPEGDVPGDTNAADDADPNAA